MKSAPFAYHAPTSLDDALGLLAADEEARPLAGGQSLMPLLHARALTPRALVDLGRVPGLDAIEPRNGTLTIGAMVRQRRLERDPAIAANAPLLRDAVRYVGSVPIRNRGTIGGAVAQADPNGELLTALVALDATAVLRRAGGGERQVPVADLRGPTGGPPGEPGELLVELRVPRATPGWRWAFVEVNRRHNASALAAVAVGLELDGSGVVTAARVAAGGVEPRPRRLPALESALASSASAGDALRAAAQEAAAGIEGRDDLHASAAYRRHVLAVLIQRGVKAALARDDGKER